MNNQLLRSIASAIALTITTVFISGCAAQATAVQTPTATTTQETATQHPGLTDPTKANEDCPPKFNVVFTTTKGDITIEVTKAWAPNGAKRFYNMAKVGYYNDIAIFRAIDDFMFQFGIHGDPNVSAKWRNATITDDPRTGIPNQPGTLSFAQTSQPNSRSVQVFVNLAKNDFLDNPRSGSPFVPFGKVSQGSMEVIKKINTEYGENARDVQRNFQEKGNAYIKAKFPNLDYIKSAKIVIPK